MRYWISKRKSKIKKYLIALTCCAGLYAAYNMALPYIKNLIVSRPYEYLWLMENRRWKKQKINQALELAKDMVESENFQKAVKKARVIFIGDRHTTPLNLLLAKELLPYFKQRGFSNLGLECEENFNEKIKEFKLKNIIYLYLKFLRTYYFGHELFDVIYKGKKLGFEVLCIDVDIREGQFFIPEREEVMAKIIKQLLDEGKSVIAITGLLHALPNENGSAAYYLAKQLKSEEILTINFTGVLREKEVRKNLEHF